MQIPWLERNHFLAQGRIVFSALPPVRREEGLSQACFARALFFLEESAYDLITSTGPNSSYHHLRGSDFSIWMTLRALRIHSTGTEKFTPAPFPGGLRACAVQGLNEDPLLFEVLFICHRFYPSFFYFIFLFVLDFVIHWNETSMGLHVFPIPIPPPTSLSTRSLLVFPVHQVRALVLCIQPGLLICFTLDNIQVSLLFSWNIPPSLSPTESKRLFYKSVSFFSVLHIGLSLTSF